MKHKQMKMMPVHEDSRQFDGCAPVDSIYLGSERSKLSPPNLALVLSAGCLRGFAHIGVLKALAAAGIRPDLVIGASAGAVVGALYCAGVAPADIERAGMRMVVADLKQWALSRHGLWQGTRVETLIRTNLPVQRIEEFPIRFAAVATDWATGQLAIFDAGDAARAVRASTAMPGLFIPAWIGGRAYADAGLRSPLPVRVARAMGAQHVIAVNVVSDPSRMPTTGILSTLFRSVRLMVHTLAANEATEADVVIAPRLPPTESLTQASRQSFIDAGEQATQMAMAQIRPLVAKTTADRGFAFATQNLIRTEANVSPHRWVNVASRSGAALT